MPLTKRTRERSAGEHVSALIGFPHALLAHPSQGTTKELRPSIFEENYSFFLNKSKEARSEELLNLAYYTRQASTFLAFGGVRKWVVFLLDPSLDEEEDTQGMSYFPYH
ncbi:unnamed protein product [Vicia faba]|uniref:Uncharacterized protein n=1 Tax=Vicia faba TaxID=3906 RepID=A0AAV1B3X8_VICFA|nr:unnamed protein product [Vicia faba]